MTLSFFVFFSHTLRRVAYSPSARQMSLQLDARSARWLGLARLSHPRGGGHRVAWGRRAAVIRALLDGGWYIALALELERGEGNLKARRLRYLILPDTSGDPIRPGPSLVGVTGEWA